jgi:hypothetical protein
VVSGDPDAVTPQYDCALALGNRLIAAASVGVGSCWINAVAKMLNAAACRPLLREIGVPEDTLYGAGAFGYNTGPVAAAVPCKTGAVNFVRLERSFLGTNSKPNMPPSLSKTIWGLPLNQLEWH